MKTEQKQSRDLNLSFNTEEALAVYQSIVGILRGGKMSTHYNNALTSASIKIKEAFEQRMYGDGLSTEAFKHRGNNINAATAREPENKF